MHLSLQNNIIFDLTNIKGCIQFVQLLYKLLAKLQSQQGETCEVPENRKPPYLGTKGLGRGARPRYTGQLNVLTNVLTQP